MRRRGTNVASASLVVLACLLLPPAAWAQQTPSGIAGIVKDTSGAVLPGVTVEAASPALIEKVRTVVSDGEGRYSIVDLRPGAYAITFSLTGFKTVRREGIELTGGFTATVNADMQVGAVEETITVTGSSPLVDIKNTRQQKVVSSELLEVLPTSQKQVSSLAALTPGLVGSADVGGTIGVTSNVGTSFHGKTGGGNKTTFDGMRTQNQQGLGNSWYTVNAAAIEEMTLETAGGTAESIAAGFGANMIPKEGGNTFKFTFAGVYTYDGLQSDNLDDALRARGLTTTQKVVKLFDAGGSMGGPIKKDRLWFFTAQRVWGLRSQVAGLFWNKTQGTPFYTPDLTRPWIRSDTTTSQSLRLTWQASPKNKVSAFVDPQNHPLRGTAGQFVAPEAVCCSWHFWPTGLFQMTWNAPKTNRLLLEAGASVTLNHWPSIWPEGVKPTDISILELSTGFVHNAHASIAPGSSTGLGRIHTGDRYSQRFSVSYVTGSHAFKVGVQLEQGIRNMQQIINGDVQYHFLNGVPVTVRQFATPYLAKDRIKADLGIFVQDQWTVQRLTLNYGLRFDYFNAYVPEQHLPAGPWVGARDFAPVHGVPELSDLNPRLGASYDLFGAGKTALKVSLGRYVGPADLNFTGSNNPLVTSVNQVDRPWTDANGNYVPDCDLRDPAANGECGRMANQNFGKLNPTATRYADEVRRGFGHRDYNWDVAAELQHEIHPGVSVSGGYYRNWYGNFLTTNNLAVTPADYSPYCIRAPIDARLPGGGGSQICGLYDINPDKFGQVNNLVTLASNYGKVKRVNDFFGLTINTRFKSGMRLGGGIDTGRTVTDDCFAATNPALTTAVFFGVNRSPQDRLYCHIVIPWSATLQVKLNGSYPLPGDFVVSGIFQNVAGPTIEANFPAPTALVAPSLGRNLAGGVRSVTAPLMQPQMQFEERLTQVDLRLTKFFKKFFTKSSRARLQANFDVYNMLNANSILSRVNTFGSSWGRPSSILDGRLVEFSGQLTF